MGRFTAEATTRVNFEANTTQLEGILKQLQAGSQVPLGDNLSKEVKALENETQQFIDNLKKLRPEDLTVDMMRELAKKEKQLVEKSERINQKIIASVSKATSTEIKKLETEIKQIDEDITQRQQQVEKLEKKFVEDPSGPADVKFARGGDETQFVNAKLKELKLEEQLVGVSGQKTKNNKAMLENAANIEKTLQGQKDIYDKISGDLEKGASLQKIKKKLTDDEFKVLEETLAKNHANIPTEKALQQVTIKRRIEQEKINFLNSEKNRLDTLNSEILLQTNQREQKRKQIEKEIGKAKKSTTKEQQQQLEYSNQLSKLNMEASSGLTKTISDLRESTKQTKKAVEEKTDAVKKNQTTIGKATQQVFSYGIAFTVLRRIYRETLRTVKDLDKALTEMAIVTSMNRSET